MRICHKIWLECDGMVVFGKGREELLRAIDEMQSLSGAARKLGMSYRAAWGKLRASEQRLGVKLVTNSGRGKGMQLTNEARVLLDKFDTLEREMAAYLVKASDLFVLTPVKKDLQNVISTSRGSVGLLAVAYANLLTFLDQYLQHLAAM